MNKNTDVYELRNVESKNILNISNDELFKWTLVIIYISQLAKKYNIINVNKNPMTTT